MPKHSLQSFARRALGRNTDEDACHRIRSIHETCRTFQNLYGMNRSGVDFYSVFIAPLLSFLSYSIVYHYHAVIALVSTQQTGVAREDDWDGFGQRLTGSGTTRFTGARVETERVYDFAQRFRYQTAFYQHVLLATLAGIGLAVERDAAQGVKHRSRMYSHGNAAVPRDDAQVLQVVGQISSWAWATRAAVLQAAESLQQAYVAHVSDDEALIARRNQLAEVEAAQAQVIASDWIPRAATELFNALGASDTRTRLALDRHWRNARTVASHNPVIYKARNIGNWLVNGEAPTFIWQIGNGEKTAG